MSRRCSLTADFADFGGSGAGSLGRGGFALLVVRCGGFRVSFLGSACFFRCAAAAAAAAVTAALGTIESECASVLFSVAVVAGSALDFYVVNRHKSVETNISTTMQARIKDGIEDVCVPGTGCVDRVVSSVQHRHHRRFRAAARVVKWSVLGVVRLIPFSFSFSTQHHHGRLMIQCDSLPVTCRCLQRSMTEPGFGIQPRMA